MTSFDPPPRSSKPPDEAEDLGWIWKVIGVLVSIPLTCFCVFNGISGGMLFQQLMIPINGPKIVCSDFNPAGNYASAEIAAGFESESCGVGCWRGLTIGESRQTEVALIAALEWHELALQQIDAQEYRLQPNRDTWYSDIHYRLDSEERISRIGYSLNAALTAQDLIALWGEPRTVYVENLMGPPDALNPCWAILLFWDDQARWASLDTLNGFRFDTVPPDTLITQIGMGRPEAFEDAWGEPLSLPRLIEWDGFEALVPNS